jgi:hypothetical protein
LLSVDDANGQYDEDEHQCNNAANLFGIPV